MTAIQVRAEDRDSTARFLGWFSIGLGTAELAAPNVVATMVGADGNGRTTTIVRAMGMRELGHGTLILTQRRPTLGVASRILGDALDLSLLALTAIRHPERRLRVAVGMANVVAVAVPDVMETRHLARKRGQPRSGKLIMKSVTVLRPREDVEQAWLRADHLRRLADRGHARVRFADAPGARGTELIIEYVEDPPAGDLGRAVVKLSGRDLATELSDELRRLKQQIETGEVVRSDATPAGHERALHLKQRPAQPLAEVPQ